MVSIGSSYASIPKAFADFFRKNLGMALVRQDDFKSQPKYPFVTYKIINPRIDTALQAGANAGFSVEVSFGINGYNENETLDYAMYVRTALDQQKVRDTFANQGVFIERVINVYERPREIAREEYVYVTGIDVRVAIEPKGLPDFDYDGVNAVSVSNINQSNDESEEK